jgi:hypothetical protein
MGDRPPNHAEAGPLRSVTQHLVGDLPPFAARAC